MFKLVYKFFMLVLGPRLLALSCVCLLASTAAIATAQASDLAEPQAAPQVPAQALRDPTRPLGHSAPASGPAAQRYSLTSVLISSQRKVAIINGASLREGQVIPGSDAVRVARISPQTVVLQQGSKTWSLRLAPSVVIRH